MKKFVIGIKFENKQDDFYCVEATDYEDASRKGFEIAEHENGEFFTIIEI